MTLSWRIRSRRCCIIRAAARARSWRRRVPAASKSRRLALPQCCISAAVAAVLRDAGATQVVAAAQADEKALFEALDRALRPRLA